jgi:hypothetical protein
VERQKGECFAGEASAAFAFRPQVQRPEAPEAVSNARSSTEGVSECLAPRVAATEKQVAVTTDSSTPATSGASQVTMGATNLRTR